MSSDADLFALALRHHQAGELNQAEQIYHQIIQADPKHSESHHLLGVIFYQTGRFEQAATSIRLAIALNPWPALYRTNLGAVWEALGRKAEAAACYQQAIQLKPDFAEAHCNLANVLFADGKLEEAVAQYRLAVQYKPDYSQAYCGLANALQLQGELEQAALHYRQALSNRPDFPEAHNGLGNALANRGQYDEAVTHYWLALRSKPDFAEAYNGLGNVLERQGKPEKLDEAIHYCREALRLKPDFAEAYYNLGNALERKDLFDEVKDCYVQALRLKPRFAEALSNLGSILLRQGQVQRATECFRHALMIRPELRTAQSNVLFALNYNPDLDMDYVFEEHRRWGLAVSELASRERKRPEEPFCPHPNNPDPDRRLKIGYLSPDFRYHPLTRYFEPVLANHDPHLVEVFCYAEVVRPDAVTARMQMMAHGWHWTCGQSDDQVAEQIRGEKIDILVDLAGHSAGNRLPVLALKPAPIQATWLGYLNTTGLMTVDYRITDAILDPPSEPVRDTEELFRLPSGMSCFAIPDQGRRAGSVSDRSSRTFTFGSLSALFKLNDRVFDLWCNVLKAVPDSRLLMFHHTLTGTACEDVRKQFTDRGIADERLDLRQGTPAPGYLSVYSEIDISLDPFPYSGGVTTCESLWMGVPVLTLCGLRPAGRNTAAILTRVGLNDWIADTPEQYVALAVKWAADLGGLAALRAGLRERMTKTICDAKRFTVELEEAYRTMWRRWCGANS